MARRATADRILDIAERLTQTKGFNAFSYADVAGELGITKASLHYHFASKAELGRRLLERYHRAFFAALDDIDRTSDRAPAKLERYVGRYAAVLAKNRMCLCGMLAAELTTLPKAMRDGVRAFFAANEAWVEGVLDAGVAEHSLRVVGSTRSAAARFVASLEGAMVLARAFGEGARFESATRAMLSELAAA